MADSLGILVTTEKYLSYVIALTDAAHKKGKSVEIFFTGASVPLCFDDDFKLLEGKARVSVCDVSFRAKGFHGREDEVVGVGFRDFATQARNAEMSAECDRYVVL